MDEFLGLEDIKISWDTTVKVDATANNLMIESPIPTVVWIVGFQHQYQTDDVIMFINFLN